MRVILIVILFWGCWPIERGPSSGSNGTCIELFQSFFQYKTASKRFNDTFLSFVPRRGLKRTFGIEDEFLIPSDIGRRGVADFLEAELKKAYPRIEIKRNYYTTHVQDYIDHGFVYDTHALSYVLNGETKRWKILPEEIWSLPIDTTICEIASPIMKTKKDMDFYLSFIKKLRDNKGARSYPSSAGVHYHYGVEDLHENELKLFFFTYLRLNDDLTAFFSKRATREHVFDLSVWNDDLSKIFNDSGSNIFNEQYVVQYKKSILRYDKDLRTIELRLLNSSMEPDVMRAGFEVHSKLVDAIRTQNPELMDYLAKSFTQKKNVKLLDVAQILEFQFMNDESLKQLINEGL